MSPCALEPNSLDLVLGKPLFRSVIELCRPRTLVCRHFLSVLERSAVGEVGGDTGSPECVTANFLGDARRRGALADHPPRIRLVSSQSFTFGRSAPRPAPRPGLVSRSARGTKGHRLLAIGLVTRPVAALFCGFMAVAAFHVHLKVG